MSFIHYSEYLVKVKQALPDSLLTTLQGYCDQQTPLALLTETDVKGLQQIIDNCYPRYYQNVMPKVDLTEGDAQQFRYELAYDNWQIRERTLLSLSTEQHSNRFLAFLFLINKNRHLSHLIFPTQSAKLDCLPGDLLIIPSNFSHRFYLEATKPGAFTAITLYACL